MKWELALIAAVLLGVAGVSRRLMDTPFTPAIAFVLIGLLLGPIVIDELTVATTSGTIRTLAEATAEAVVLAVLLAPTDAALGQAVVTEPRLPSRIRQGLNAESGLNDGICVPLLLIALAAADVEDNAATGLSAFRVVAEEVGYGIVGGVVAGLIAALVLAVGHRRHMISGTWLQVIPIAGAALAYGIAAPTGRLRVHRGIRGGSHLRILGRTRIGACIAPE